MTLRSSARLAAILALAALPACAADLAPPAAAQQHVAQAGPGPMGPMGPEGHRFHHRHHGPGAAMFAPERIEGRLAFLKTELKITDAQLPQWNAFADAMRVQAKEATARRAEWHAAREARHAQPGQAQPGQAHQRGERREAKPLPERMANMERMMQAHLARLQKMRTAVEPLYGVLSPEQRKAADTLLLRG